jgi:hypothetical protein
MHSEADAGHFKKRSAAVPVRHSVYQQLHSSALFCCQDHPPCWLSRLSLLVCVTTIPPCLRHDYPSLFASGLSLPVCVRTIPPCLRQDYPSLFASGLSHPVCVRTIPPCLSFPKGICVCCGSFLPSRAQRTHDLCHPERSEGPALPRSPGMCHLDRRRAFCAEVERPA